jgi:hypothetical protein
MTVYDERTQEVLSEYNLNEGCVEEKEVTIHHEPTEEIPAQYHYEKMSAGNWAKVIDRPTIPAHEAYDEKVKRWVYHKYSIEELIRVKREKECFPIINRGQAWYNLLSYDQRQELDKWYIAWLNATETGIIPEKPEWLNKKINITEDVL